MAVGLKKLPLFFVLYIYIYMKKKYYIVRFVNRLASCRLFYQLRNLGSMVVINDAHTVEKHS